MPRPETGVGPVTGTPDTPTAVALASVATGVRLGIGTHSVRRSSGAVKFRGGERPGRVLPPTARPSSLPGSMRSADVNVKSFRVAILSFAIFALHMSS